METTYLMSDMYWLNNYQLFKIGIVIVLVFNYS